MKQKEITYIQPKSAGKILGVLYAIFGLVFGLFFTLISIFTSSASGNSAEGIIFGFGSVIVLPILYGVMGFLAGVLGAIIYNFIAKKVGGLKLDLQVVDAEPKNETDATQEEN